MLGKVRAIGAAAAVLATVSMAVPAEAQWRGRYPPRHRDRIDGGDVLLGALIAGGIIALATSGDRRRADPPPPPADAPPPPPRIGDPRYGDGTGGGPDDRPVDVVDEDSAVDSCAAAAEDEGRGMARLAQVTGISRVDAAANGWTVRGTIELGDGYRGQRRPYGFTCSVAQGIAPAVRFDGQRYSAR
ncbi:hypothetical protein [Sphingomonas sp.]|uniref:hypothetical protein n=1 Tax=Sphingomonas sp. TaxID=28214 RepID=UPI001EBB0172|nr:hypothetical protein [Sphingomonas sp.]MBX3595443.1 hypothetical protein [Sphingomonas sp.]